MAEADHLDAALAVTDSRALLLLIRQTGGVTPEDELLAAFADSKRAPTLVDEIIAVLFVHPDDRAVVSNRLPRLAPMESTLAFLLPWKAPPRTGHRDDGPVRSFLAPYASFVRAGLLGEDPETWCYRIATEVLAGQAVANVRVVQLPEPSLPVMEVPCTMTMVIAHRGPIELLGTCLDYVFRQTLLPNAVYVAFDEPIDEARLELMRNFPNVSWMRTEPSGGGPYTPRQQLANGATTERVIFQDSDDIPCRERVRTMAGAFRAAEMVGSHELRIDDLAQNVRAIRFPEDVTAALSIRPNHSLFHPTSTVNTDAFRRSGGFSTNRNFASDVQYLLRAFFLMKSIRNLDAFLYVRRKRPDSLTTRPDTHSRSPVRLELEERWCNAFKAVREGRIALASSALAIEPGPPAAVLPIKAQS